MASKKNGHDMSEWARAPPTGTAWTRLGKAIYNPEEKSFLGRTLKRWGIGLLFYLVFYIVLALMFGACMGSLMLLIKDSRPHYTLGDSLIGNNPGVAARPLPTYDMAVRFSAKNSSDLEGELKTFLSGYQDSTWFNAKTNCKESENYGYPLKPCLYIKLNKIFDWVPEYYDDPASLPADTPADLKAYITNLAPSERKQIWVSCWMDGNPNATFEYPWGRGLPAQFYPFSNQKSYQSPLVAVQVTPPVNKDVRICCRAWAKNIIFNKSQKEPSGYIGVILHMAEDQ